MGYVPCRQNKVMTTPPASAARARFFPIGWTPGDGINPNRADAIDDSYRSRPQPTGNSISCLPVQFVNVLDACLQRTSLNQIPKWETIALTILAN
jgi:hypothetical protein